MDFERRPNPKGWTPPKAPYNPYDPTDLRPPEGYPSEFKIPGNQPSGFSSVPRNPTQYKKVNETMKRLNYTPRPASELYPGQYKVLRRVDTNQRLNTGTRWFGMFVVGTIIVYGSFFIRWNDGSENVMSSFYRARLKLEEKMGKKLSDQDYEDLYYPKESKVIIKPVKDSEYIPDELRRTTESAFALNTPSERHVLEATRRLQDQEEAMLRELDDHEKFAKTLVFHEEEQNDVKPVSSKSSWWKWR